MLVIHLLTENLICSIRLFTIFSQSKIHAICNDVFPSLLTLTTFTCKM